MTQHDDLTRIRHMLDYSREAVDMLAGNDPEDLRRNRIFQLALVGLVEVIGEVASRVSDAGQRRYPSIPWQTA